MKCNRILILLLLISFSTDSFSQYITVDDNRSASDLVNNVLINSPCAAISNISVSGGNLGVNDNSFGYFNSNSSGFLFNDGVILSTGKAKSAIGPNNSLLSEDGLNWSSFDSDLQQALGISGTENVTILEFDFVPLTNKFSFEYIFSSEQYLSNPTSFQCGFTDGFAFLLKEVGTQNYQNLAIVPGTNNPVSVKTIRGSGTVCQAQNEQYFGGINGVNHPTNFNGQTKPLKAEATVIPSKKYHIKLVIADQGNFKYDSAIFLAGGSFKVGVDLGNDQIIFNKNALCFGENKILDATQLGNNTYKWFKDGIDTGITTPIFNVTDNTNTGEVLYEVEVGLGASTCVAKGKIKIQFAKKPILKTATITECDDNLDGKSKFNLTQLDDFIRSDSGNSPLLSSSNAVNYFKDNAATIAIPNPTAYENFIANNDVVYAQVSNDFGCSTSVAIDLKVTNNPIPAQTITVCDEDGNQDGKITINLDSKVTTALQQFIPAGAILKYYLNLDNAISQSGVISNLFTTTTANEQILYGRISNTSTCIAIVKIILKIISFNSNDFKDEIKFICPNKTLRLEVPAGFSYIWSTGNTSTNFITISSTGTYTVKISNTNNCSITKSFNVQNVDLANITSIDVNDFSENNTIFVNYSGGGDYEFSIDGINFQNSNLFENVPFGDYKVTIRDKNKCNDVVSKIFSVLDFPKFFTPNNDGFNDFWKIEKLAKNSTIAIYDRFGKVIIQFDNNSNGWNGTFNEQLLPASDYWFVLTLENNRIIKNHFALLR